MESGIFHFNFRGGPTGNFGEGIAVFKDGTINGGDVGYTYRGSYRTDDHRLVARIKVKQWRQVPNALFPSPEFEIHVDSPLPTNFDNFTLEGRVEGAGTINLVGRRLEKI
jgi:hypothetical protein